MLAGQSIWFMLLAYVCSFLGALQVPAFLVAIAYSAVGFIYNWRCEEDAVENSSESKNQSMLERCAHFWESPIIKSTPNRQQTTAAGVVEPSAVQPISSPIAAALVSDDDNPTAVLKTKLELNLKTAKTTSELDDQPKSQSAIYFKALFLACLVTILYKQLFVLALSFIPVLVYVAKNLLVTFGIKELLWKTATDSYCSVQVSSSLCCCVLSSHTYNYILIYSTQDWIFARQSALLPLCLPGILKLNTKVHTYVRITLRDSVDTASSILVIILLILVVIFASVFCVVEIYSETITVVQLGSDVINYTISHRPELMDMFPAGKLN